MEENNNEKSNLSKIIKGILIAYGITFILIFIYAILLAYTRVPESTIPTIVSIICIVSVLISSALSTKNIKEKGLINGAIIGGVYILVIYILSSISTAGFGISGYSFLTILFSIIAGIVGGIVGVNLSQRS